jgi:LPXTG-motif cell wall-anchored protein
MSVDDVVADRATAQLVCAFMPARSGVIGLSRTLARLVALLIGTVAVSLVAAGAASATPDPEDYPPDAIVNLIDPFGCEPPGISGEIGAVQAGSAVTLQLLINGVVVDTVTATAGADGQAGYTIPVPANQFGPAIVRASGTNSVGEPFDLDSSGTITQCPPLPRTGNSDTGRWLTIGAGAVLAGGVLVAVASRRRRGVTTT